MTLSFCLTAMLVVLALALGFIVGRRQTPRRPPLQVPGSPASRVLATIVILSLILTALALGAAFYVVRDPPTSNPWEHYRNVATVFAAWGTFFGIIVAATSLLAFQFRSLLIAEAERAIGTWSKLNSTLSLRRWV